MAWGDEIAKDGVEPIYFLRIEGWPVWVFHRTPPSSWTRPEWDPGDPTRAITFVDGLDIPGAIRRSIHLFDGIGEEDNVTFRFHDLPESGSLAPLRFSRSFATGRAWPGADATVYSAYVTDDVVARAATQISVSDDSTIPALPFLAYLGNETIRVDSNAGGLLYNVTRAMCPAVNGGGGSMIQGDVPLRHENRGTDVAGLLLADVPYTWFNRRIALYGTWKNADGTYGALADAKRIWAGRVGSLSYDASTDQWALDCTSLINDLRRPIVREARATLRGVDFTGLAAEERTVLLRLGCFDTTPFPPAGMELWQYATLPARVYADADDVTRQLNQELRPLANWATTVNASHVTTIFTYENSTNRVRIDVLDWTALFETANLSMTVDMAPSIARVLGFPPGGTVYLSETTTLRAIADEAPASTYWQASSSVLTVGTQEAAGFATAQSAVTDPALLIDGLICVRYDTIDATFSEFSGLNGNGLTEAGDYLLEGDPWVIRRVGESDQAVPVVQAYAMRRSFGSVGFSLFDELLRLIVSTGEAVNGAWDNLSTGYGLGVPEEYVDAVSFAALEASYSPEMLERLWIVADDFTLEELIRQEGATLGFYVVQAGGGLTCRRVQSLRPDNLTLQLTLDNDPGANGGGADLPLMKWSPAACKNLVQISYGWSFAEDGYMQIQKIKDPVSIGRYENERRVEIDNKGLYDWGGGGYQAIEADLQARLVTYADPHPEIDRATTRDMFTRIDPGDIVFLSDAYLPNPWTGLRGLVDVPMLVIEVEDNLATCVGRVVLQFDALRPSSQDTPLCPSIRFLALIAGADYSVSLLEFSTISGDIASFSAGDELLVYRVDEATPLAATTALLTVVAVGPGHMELDAALPAGLDPASYLVCATFADRATAVVAQYPRGTWIADPATAVVDFGGGASQEPGHLYD